MIDSPQQAVNEMFTMVKEAWEASPFTMNLDIVWGNVSADYQGTPDLFGDPTPWLHVKALHETSTKASLRGPEGSRFENTGSLICMIHVPEGRSSVDALPLIQVVSDAFQGQASPSGVWFRNPQLADIGPLGSWYIMSFVATFLYDQIR